MKPTQTWHYEGHYILTDSEPQEIVAEKVSEANRGLIASAPELQAKIEALTHALERLLLDGDAPAHKEAHAVLRSLGRV